MADGSRGVDDTQDGEDRRDLAGWGGQGVPVEDSGCHVLQEGTRSFQEFEALERQNLGRARCLQIG